MLDLYNDSIKVNPLFMSFLAQTETVYGTMHKNFILNILANKLLYFSSFYFYNFKVFVLRVPYKTSF